jgi:hypothetical protein
MDVFHEFHHFLSWQKDPSNFEREKGLPPDHPLEIEDEMKGFDDFTDFIKEKASREARQPIRDSVLRLV